MNGVAELFGLSVVAAAPILVLLALLIADLWVYTDAKALDARGTPVVFSIGSFSVDTPVGWFVGCLLLSIVAFPLYVISRHVGS